MKVIGIGNALVDLLTAIDNDLLLDELNLPKGSMQLVDGTRLKKCLDATSQFDRTLAAGGSAANAIHGLAQLGVETGFIGKIGSDDLGNAFRSDMETAGIKPVLFRSKTNTGTALALISTDAERTFAVNLGAAIELVDSDLTASLFEGYQLMHVEGYLVQNHSLIETAVRLAKESGLTVSLDLASYNVVEENLDFLKNLVAQYVDIVFANEDEAKAFTGKDPEQSLALLASMTKIAVVKLGAKGSIIQQGNEIHRIGIVEAKPVDATGAGDLYASGFVYGLSKNLPLNTCGEMGALLAGRVIETVGPKLNTHTWAEVRGIIAEAIRNGKPLI